MCSIIFLLGLHCFIIIASIYISIYNELMHNCSYITLQRMWYSNETKPTRSCILYCLHNLIFTCQQSHHSQFHSYTFLESVHQFSHPVNEECRRSVLDQRLHCVLYFIKWIPLMSLFKLGKWKSLGLKSGEYLTVWCVTGSNFSNSTTGGCFKRIVTAHTPYYYNYYYYNC